MLSFKDNFLKKNVVSNLYRSSIFYNLITLIYSAGNKKIFQQDDERFFEKKFYKRINVL